MRELRAAAFCLVLIALGVPAAAQDASPSWLQSTPPAPPAYAPAFGHDAGEGLTVDVRPESGASTLFDIDLRQGGLTLRRTRSSGSTADGVFGRGWVSDVDARVTPLAGGFAVRRLQGMTLFVPLQGKTYVSLWGDVELLRQTDDGFELASACGRVFRFDQTGVLSALVPEFELRRANRRIEMVGADSTWTVRLGADGHVDQIDAGDAELTYRYTGGALATVRGAAHRTYGEHDGRLVRVADSKGDRLRLSYDRRGRLVTLDSGDWRQSYRYTEDERSASVQTPRGMWTYHVVDRGWIVESPNGRERVRFDVRGRVLASTPQAGTDPWPTALPGGPVERVHDAQGRVQEVRGPGAVETLAWDDAGRLVARTSVDGRTSRYAYDADGRLIEDASPAGSTRYGYDSHGHVRRVRTPEGVSWTVRRSEGAVVSEDGPAGQVRYSRKGGRLVRRQDASGVTLDYRYGPQGRPVDVAAASGESIRFAYGPRGGLSAWSGAAGTTRVRHVGSTETVTRGPVTVRTTRTASGETVTTPFGSIDRTRDGQGKLTRLKTPAGTFQFRYDAHGLRTRLTYPNGVNVEIDRDGLGRARSRRATRGARVLSALETTYNERHEVARRRERSQGETRVSTFAYDGAGRLASVRSSGGERTYAYDGDGNRTVEARGRAARKSTYDERGRLTARGPERFTHDAAGRLIERSHPQGRDRFGYDGFGRLDSVKRAGQPRVRFGYDGLGRIVTRTVGSATTRLVYEGDRLLAEVGPGKRRRVFVYGPELDEPLAYSDGGEWTYLISNDLHTSMAYVDSSGRSIGQATVSPFGEVLRADASRPLFFAGRLYDPIARVYPMRARVYDPSLGRFLTPDPSGLAGGINAYAYVRNRPLDRCDPLGLWDWVPDWAERAAASVGDASASAVSGTNAFLAHTTGFAEHMWEDVEQGRARDRIYGTVDAYTSFLTFGLLGSDLSQYADNADEAARGEVYGEAAGWAVALISGRELLAAGAKGVVNGVRALPQAPGMIMNGARSARASAPTWIPRAREALASAPGAAVNGVKWLNANRGPLGASLLGFLQSQGAGIWNVTGRPFVSAGEAGIDLLKGLVSSAKAAMPSAKTASAAKSAGASSTSVPAAASETTTVVRTVDTVGASGRLEGQTGTGAVRTIKQVRRTNPHVPPGAPAGYQSAHLEPPGYIAHRIDRAVAAVRNGEAGSGASADDVRHFLNETYEHADEVATLTRALGGASRSIPEVGPLTGPLRGIHDFGERASVRRVKEFVDAVKRKPLADRDGNVIPVPTWLDDVVRDAELAGEATVDVGKLSPHVSAGLGRAGPPDPYAIKFHNLSPHHGKAWGPNATPESKTVVEAVADMVAAMRQPRAYRPRPLSFDEIRTNLQRSAGNGELPAGSEALIERAIATQARLERTPGSGVNPYYLWEEGAAAETSAALAGSRRVAAPEAAVAEEVSFGSLSAEDQALIRSLEKRIDDETLAYMHVDDGLGIRNNASGESAASLEAISRARENRFLIVDRQGSVVRELQGAESVDFNAPRYLESGQAFVLQNRSTGVVTVWDTKGVSADAVRENATRALSSGN